MFSNQKASELIEKYGKQIALEVANTIFKEHYEYQDPNYIWRGDFGETYTNTEKCQYWNEVRTFIEKS